VPATSMRGGVVCLSGRTAAYRRSAVLPVLHNLEHEYFFNRKCVAGDDGRLTWLVLAQGYKTVHQDTARALSMFPASFKSFCKQRVRWSRNSYRCYLTCIYKGWLWRMPFISQLTVFQILFTPVTMFAAVYYVSSAWFSPQRYIALTLGISWMFLGRAIRSISHLRSRPEDLLLLPLVTLLIAFVALPIKTVAFFTMNKQGWLTRRKDLIGGEGQDNASLTPDARGDAVA
jgi:cellulose synthase/poly-beta-1,6-N-acetylglucosamine synthase-like glycosyltransferase